MSAAAEVGVVASAVLAVCGVVGLVVRFVLLPYLRDQVVDPLQETHRQVTPHNRPNNGEAPTIVDRLDDVQTGVADLRGDAEGLTAKAERNRRLAREARQHADEAHRKLEDHEAWAREEDRRLWRAIEREEPPL